MKVKSENEVAESCPTLSDPMDCSLLGSSVHRIFQARVLEWGAIAFSVIHTSLHNMLTANSKRRLVKIIINDKEKAMAPHSSTLAWKIPWMEEPGRLQSMGSLRVRLD